MATPADIDQLCNRLLIACVAGSVDATRRLYRECRVNEHRLNIHMTRVLAFNAAVVNGRRAVVECLLREFPDDFTYIIFDNNCESLQLAAQHGHVDVAELLMRHGANHRDEALAKAASYGHVPVVNAILNSGGVTADGIDRALFEAAKYNNIAVAKVLLDRGAHVNSVMGAALSYAVLRRHNDMVEFLLQNGADVHLDNNITRAIEGRDSAHIVTTLLRYGAMPPAGYVKTEADERAIAQYRRRRQRWQLMRWFVATRKVDPSIRKQLITSSVP